MGNWRETHECYKCHRRMILGVSSWGTSHQSVHAIVCEECATPEDLAVPDATEIDEMIDDDGAAEALQKYMKWSPKDFPEEPNEQTTKQATPV